MNLIFYPADFNLSYIKDRAQKTISELESKKEEYLLFDYNYYSVVEQKDLSMCRAYGRKLIVALNFIKDYVSKNTNQKYNIYFHTDGYSDRFEKININDYITDNINKFIYIDSRNENFCGDPDFQESWLNNSKFFYIS
jgi:hypothetical protein